VRDRRGQIERLRLAIEAAVRGERVAAPTVVAPRRTNIVVEDVDLDAPPDWAVPYRRVVVDGQDHPRWCPYEPQSTDARPYLRRYFEALLQVEAPVHEDRLLAAFRDDWGVGRVGHVIKANIRAALDRAKVGGLPVTHDEAGFYRVEGQPFTAARVPVDAESIRPVSQVPPEELDLAVLGTVRDARFVEEDMACLAVARLFGWRRQGLDIQTAVGGSISRLLFRDKLERTATGELRVVDG
jgi:Protein of unknown function (DUF3320)